MPRGGIRPPIDHLFDILSDKGPQGGQAASNMNHNNSHLSVLASNQNNLFTSNTTRNREEAYLPTPSLDEQNLEASGSDATCLAMKGPSQNKESLPESNLEGRTTKSSKDHDRNDIQFDGKVPGRKISEKEKDLSFEELEALQKILRQKKLKADLEEQIKEKRRQKEIEREREKLFNEQEEQRIAAERAKLKEQWEREQAERLMKVKGDEEPIGSSQNFVLEHRPDIPKLTSSPKPCRNLDKFSPAKTINHQDIGEKHLLMENEKANNNQKSDLKESILSSSSVIYTSKNADSTLPSSHKSTHTEQTVAAKPETESIINERTKEKQYWNEKLEEMQRVCTAAAESEKRCKELLHKVTKLVEENTDKTEKRNRSTQFGTLPNGFHPPYWCYNEPTILCPMNVANPMENMFPSLHKHSGLNPSLAVANSTMPYSQFLTKQPTVLQNSLIAHKDVPTVYYSEASLNPMDSRPPSQKPLPLSCHKYKTLDDQKAQVALIDAKNGMSTMPSIKGKNEPLSCLEACPDTITCNTDQKLPTKWRGFCPNLRSAKASSKVANVESPSSNLSLWKRLKQSRCRKRLSVAI